jgi:PAS domain S-box-containing protein
MALRRASRAVRWSSGSTGWLMPAILLVSLVPAVVREAWLIVLLLTAIALAGSLAYILFPRALDHRRSSLESESSGHRGPLLAQASGDTDPVSAQAVDVLEGSILKQPSAAVLGAMAMGGNHRFRAVAETSVDAIISADNHGYIVYWNKGAERMFGLSRVEAVGKPLTILMPERFRQAHLAGITRFVSTGDPHVIGKIVELAGLRKDGTEFPLELSLTAWETPDGPFFTGIIRDITQRKSVERRLAAEHTVTRVLAESVSLGEATPKILQAICESLGWQTGAFWTVDEHAKLLRCSETWHSPSLNLEKFETFTKKTTFLPGVGLPGRVWTSGEPAWIPDVLKDTNFPRAPVAAQEGLHGAFGFPIRSANRVLGVMEFFSHQVREPDEALLQMLGAIGSQIGQFIERRRAEERISALNEYIQTILDSVPNPILIIGHDTRVQYINRTARETFARSQSNAEGQTLFNFMQADRATEEHLRRNLEEYMNGLPARPADSSVSLSKASALRDPLSPVMGASEPVSRQEIKIGTSRYEYVWFDVNARTGDGNLIGLVLRDTTDESRMHDQLIQAEKLAGIALLTSGLAHELNNPLYIVMGLSEAILDEQDPATMREHAGVVVGEAKRMARILQDLTGRTRIEASDFRTTVDLNEQLDRALELTQPDDGGENLAVHKSYQATRGIQANPLELRQVFANILSNAIQAMNGKGALFVGTEADTSAITVRIRDTGPGIPAAYVSKIFDPFFTTKKQGEGAGLGLTIAHRLVTKLGGRILVESGEGQGTTFIMTFPISQ